MQHATWLRPQTVPRETCTHLILRCPSLDVLGGASRAMGAAVAPCAGRLVEGAHTILSGDLALSGVIWRMSAHQRPRAPSGGRPSEGRYRRLAGAALRFP